MCLNLIWSPPLFRFYAVLSAGWAVSYDPGPERRAGDLYDSSPLPGDSTRYSLFFLQLCPEQKCEAPTHHKLNTQLNIKKSLSTVGIAVQLFRTEYGQIPKLRFLCERWPVLQWTSTKFRLVIWYLILPKKDFCDLKHSLAPFFCSLWI